MKTIALRFGEHFSPECGTIVAHEEIIKEYGFVWYGKMGNKISQTVVEEILSMENPRILLIRSGKMERYWAIIEAIQYKTPKLDYIPEYYRDNTEKFKTWFKVSSFITAPKNIMSKCFVASSKKELGLASKYSMSPYFIIEYNE